MKGLYTNKTKVSEPIAKSNLSGYGIGCLGGFCDKGRATFYQVIGGQISFNSEDLTGQLTLIRQPKLDFGSMAYGLWNDRLAKLRRKQRTIIANKLTNMESSQKTDGPGVTKTFTILNQFKFKAFIQTSNIASVIEQIYNSKWVKQMVQFGEQWLTMAFVQKGTQIPAQGTIDKAVDYYIGKMGNSQAQITRIRVNKGIWTAWCRHVGYDHRIAALEWTRLHDVYGNAGDHTIDVESQLDAVFDEISKRPTLTEIPDLAAYIADTLIGIALFNLTVAALNVDDWYATVPYSMIMENISDKQVTAALKVITAEWGNTQVIVPAGDLGPKRDFNVLPFWDGSTLHQSIEYPCLSLAEIAYTEVDYEERDNEGKVTSQSVAKLKLVQLVTVNASPDGSVNANHILFNRVIGPLSSLSDTGEISQLTVNAVYPWILGVQQPEESNVHLERRHWPLVYLHTIFDKPPVYADTLIEAMLVGLKTYLGPNYYLINLDDFLQTDPLALVLNDREKDGEIKNMSGTLFSSKISMK